MGQQLSHVNEKLLVIIKNDSVELTSDGIIDGSGKDDILTLLNVRNPFESGQNNRIPVSERLHTKQIQNHLFQLTNSAEHKSINLEIHDILFENIFKKDLANDYQKMISEVEDILDKQKILQTDLCNKIKEEKNVNKSIFNNNKIEHRTQQLSYFAIQSLTSLLLILIKSTEKHDPTIVQQILTLTSQLCEQMPMKCLSSSTNNTFLVKSLKPLTTYINDLSLREDPTIKMQVTKILLCFGIAKDSFKDILPILNKLIFQLDGIYDAKDYLIQLNDDLTNAIETKTTSEQITSIPLDYLKSIQVFPTDQLMELNDDQFTGRFLASVILAHIDFDHAIHSEEQLNSSLFFEFHHDTFQQLFYLIKQLTRIFEEQSNPTVDYMLNVCLRLFTTHLKFLYNVKSNIDRDVLITNNFIKDNLKSSSSSSQENLDLTKVATDTELEEWFQFLLKLACMDNHIISKEASKGLVFLLDKNTFINKLSFIHQFIIENKHPVIIEYLWIELSKTITLLSWIEVLSSEDGSALTILYSFIDMYFNPPAYFTDENKQRTKEIVHNLQKLLLFRLGPVFEKKPEQKSTISAASSVIVKYLVRILNRCLENEQVIPDIFNDILVSLYFMTEQEAGFAFLSVQPIFVTLLPLLGDYILQNRTNDHLHFHFLSWLIGRMSYFLINSLPKDVLETKHSNSLDSILFMNGCKSIVIEKSQYLIDLFNSDLGIYSHFKWNQQEQQSSSDDEFLMSVYNNQDQGAKLISKIKIHLKNKQRFLQKSIEQFVNDACAALFAVYIKHYRRIDLAKSELLRPDHDKPHDKLLSIYEYANRVQTVFTKTKAQGGDCDELFKQIKNNSLLLLLSVKENNLIPIINENSSLAEPTTPNLLNVEQNRMTRFKRQESRWTKAKNIIRLLRNSMRACIRFRKLMISKKQSIEQKYDPESVLNHLIDDYVYGNKDNKRESDEIIQCLYRQYERAMTRLITYRFMQIFIQKILSIDDHNRALSILAIYLPHMRHIDLVEWTYTENIQASNSELKNDIANSYYSCIQIILNHLLQSTTDESMILIPSIFRLLNLSYQSIDICYLDRHQLIQTLCKSYLNFIEKSDPLFSLKTKLSGYNWFRLFVYKLCDNIQEEQIHGIVDPLLYQQRDFIFQSIIFEQLKQTLSTAMEEQTVDSLNNTHIGWFIKQATTVNNDTLMVLDVDLCINQFLIILLRCVYLYEHVRSFCATVEFIEQLIDIYHHSQYQSTRILAIKILRNVICFLPEKRNGQSTTIMKDLFNEIFISIVNKIPVEIITELIYIYRTIMSIKSTWRSIAVKQVFDSITSIPNNQESLEHTDKNKLNYFVASLCILGGYIHPYGLGSIVRIYAEDEEIDEFELAIITQINTNILDQDSSDALPYFVKYNQSNKSEWISVDKLYIDIDVLPPTLLSMYNDNDSIVTFHAIIDMLGYLLQIDTSTTTSLTLIQLKRYSIMVLYQLLNNKSLIEVFMQKSYANVIAQLALENKHSLPNDLRLFNRQHLEQYSLSLDRYVQLKTIIENEPDHSQTFQDTLSTSDTKDSSYVIWNDVKINRDQLIIDTLSTSTFKYGGWKPNASETEIELYKQGRIGSDDISIVSVPRQIAKPQVVEECGENHRFHGRINGESSYIQGSFPTFTIENLEFSEGKWYYCVKLSVGGLIQIGWATAGFKPYADNGHGVGDDIYSWCYDGSRSILYHDGGYSFPSESLYWKENDVCGCGIEIDGENTRIKYWLNGKFLGTAFSHESDQKSSTLKCNMLPNGPNTTYFPCVSVQISSYENRCCELIVSPEDMDSCPLPPGYKPLLTPKLVHPENSIVAYPYSAYLIGESKMNNSTSVLRDFVNEDHLETTFTLDDQWLILPKDSGGLSIPLNTLESSFTISFDLKITSIEDTTNNILLLKLDQTEMLSISIPLNIIDDHENEIHIAIIFDLKEQQTKIYINNKCKTFIHGLDSQIISKSKLFLLPNSDAQIRNIGLWKYILSEEHIRRLFTYGLFYVASDYQQRKEYRKQANTFIFSKNQTNFSNELLIPFNEPFEEKNWIDQKNQTDIDGSKYFTFDESSIQLFGKKTYLVLDTSNQHSSQFTLILDIFIPQFPIENEQLTLVRFASQLSIILTHTGHLCLSNTDIIKTSETIMTLNEYVRLLISVEEQAIKIYQNAMLIIDADFNYEQIRSTVNHIDLFRELDLEKNTNSEDTLRIQCKSITFRNQPITPDEIDQYMKSPNSSLEKWIAPPLSMITSILVPIGYKESWIKSIMEQYNTTNIQLIDTLIRQHKEELSKKDHENQRINILDILSKLGPYIDREKMEILIMSANLDTDEDLTAIGELIFTCWKELQISTSTSDITETENDNKEEMKWFYQTVHRLRIKDSISLWIQGKLKTYNENESVYQLIDFTKPKQDHSIGTPRKITNKSLQYSHQKLTEKQHLNSRIACENGLITMYARETIFNMLEVCLNNQSTLFPWEKFGDYTFIFKLIRLLDYHSWYSSTRTDQRNDRINSIIKSILKLEIDQLLKHNDFEKHAPILYHLQKYLIVQLIRLIDKPSLLIKNLTMIDEQMLFKEPNLDFLLKMISLLSEIVTDHQNEIDKIIPILFSEVLITLLFDVFLLVPTPQGKICILRLFVGLIKISDNIILNKEIFNFLLRLFVELSNKITFTIDQTTKRLYMYVMDFVYLLSLKNKKRTNEQQLESTLRESLEVVRDLFLVIDIIDVLNDTTKQIPLPESFTLYDNLNYKSEDFDRSNNYFDETADLQLLNLMNKKLSSDKSFDEFINCLPTESESSATIYKEYPSLSNIPGDCVRTRAKIFYQLSALIEKVLPMIDLSLSLDQSIIMEKFRKVKIYLLYQKKSELLQQSLEQTVANNDDCRPTIEFDTLKASNQSENGENTMFNQAFEQLFKDASSKFRRSDERLWHAKYVGMNSVDAGGPYRDSITCIASDICSTRLSLFILCPNGRTGSGSNQDRWIPNVFSPKESIPNIFRNQYRFVGQLMGIAIRQKHYLDLKFPTLLWKQLVREPITLEDIEAIDMQSFTIIKEMEMQIEQSQLIDNDMDIDFLFSSIMSELRFDVVSSAGLTYELVSGGKDIPITAANFKDYCRKYREYRLNEFYRQIDFIRQGLYSIIPSYYLSLFTAGELEQAVCGKGHIDVELLKRNTYYGGDFNENSPHIQRFWTVINDLFKEEQRKSFLIFVWGRSTLPTRDDDFTSKFCVNPYYASSDQINRVLPRSHTCSFAIDLPEYSTTEIMHERLNYAVTYCSSIDGD